jgi:hypothetical protein
MKYPAELYQSSTHPYTGLGELEYPFHDRTITVTLLRSHLHRTTQNQLERCIPRPKRRRQGGRRQTVAGEFYAVRSGLLRSGDGPDNRCREPASNRVITKCAADGNLEVIIGIPGSECSPAAPKRSGGFAVALLNQRTIRFQFFRAGVTSPQVPAFPPEPESSPRETFWPSVASVRGGHPPRS